MAKDSEGLSRALNSQTQIVIDAYPRSANSFAVVAFQSCQVQDVAIAHHFHAPATVIYGVQHSIPTLTIIRNPDDACLSHAIFMGDSNLRAAFREYKNFYEPILKFRDRIVVAKFETVVTNYGVAIEKVNEKFGTSFNVFDHTPENVSLVKGRLENRTIQQFGSAGIHEGHGETPTVAKEERKAQLASQLEEKSLQRLRRQAIHLYEAFNRNADV